MPPTTSRGVESVTPIYIKLSVARRSASADDGTHGGAAVDAPAAAGTTGSSAGTALVLNDRQSCSLELLVIGDLEPNLKNASLAWIYAKLPKSVRPLLHS